MSQETLIGADGKPILCWRPIPNHWLAVSAHQTAEDACEAMRRMYPYCRRPDLWASHPAVFGQPQEAR